MRTGTQPLTQPPSRSKRSTAPTLPLKISNSQQKQNSKEETWCSSTNRRNSYKKRSEGTTPGSTGRPRTSTTKPKRTSTTTTRGRSSWRGWGGRTRSSRGSWTSTKRGRNWRTKRGSCTQLSRSSTTWQRIYTICRRRRGFRGCTTLRSRRISRWRLMRRWRTIWSRCSRVSTSGSHHRRWTSWSIRSRRRRGRSGRSEMMVYDFIWFL